MEPEVLLFPYKIPLILPILSQINPGHVTQSTALTTTLMLSCHPVVSIRHGIFPSGFPTKPTTNFSSPCTCRIFRPSLPIRIIFPEKYRAAFFM
jgi:hypothetical protein